MSRGASKGAIVIFGIVILSFIQKDSRSKIYVEIYDGIVSVLNFETCCLSSAASQFPWWFPTVLFF